MMDSEEFDPCHDQEENFKVCCSSLCDSTAFVCMNCDQCLQVHQHDGTTVLMKWSILEADLKGIAAQNSAPSSKVKQVSEAFNQKICEIESILSQIQLDVEISEGSATSVDFVKETPVSSNLDQSMTDFCANSPFNSTSNSKLSDKAQTSQMSCPQELTSNYLEFSSKIAKLIDEFCRKKSVCLEKQCEEEEAMSPRSGSAEEPLTFRQSLDKQRNEESAGQTNNSPRKGSSSLSKGSSEQTQEQRPITVWRLPHSQEMLNRCWPKFFPIAHIRPGFERFNLLIKVIKVTKKQVGDRLFLNCLLGDHSATIVGRFFYSELIQKGAVLQLTDCRAHIYEGKMCINLVRSNCICVSRHNIPQVHFALNMSELNWQDADNSGQWRIQQ